VQAVYENAAAIAFHSVNDITSIHFSNALRDYSRGGQTCSMYEPHIVKATLQRAAT